MKKLNVILSDKSLGEDAITAKVINGKLKLFYKGEEIVEEVKDVVTEVTLNLDANNKVIGGHTRINGDLVKIKTYSI